MLAGCGQNGSTEEENNDVVSISEIEDTANDETLDYINDIEERVHKISFESYDEIISLLEGSEGYAYVNVKGYDGDVLAVATYTYDDMRGHMESTECTFYTIKRDGTVSADAVLTSSGTATPVSIDDDGHPTSIWGYYRTSNTVANDDNLVMLEENDIDFYNKIFDEYYDNSQPIYFTLASVSLKDYEGLYYKTEMEELEYYDVTHTTGYQFNSDGTGIY